MIVLLFRELRAPFTKQRGGKFPKQRTEAKRLVRSGRNGSHAGVTQAFRGAKRASGDRRRSALIAGTRQSQSGEKRRAGHKSSPKSQSSESRREHGVAVKLLEEH